MKQFTETDLKIEVQKFYKGTITLSKALALYELEFGYKPEILEPREIYCNIPKNDISEVINIKNLMFMKELQESGSVNMFASGEVVQSTLHLPREDARKLVLYYIKNYNRIYYPESCL